MYTLPNLPDSTAREVYARLRKTLELLPADTPEASAARDADAMRAVAAHHPTDAMEARIAADIVGLEAYATDSLRLAGFYRSDLAATMQCRAQATSMFRQMRCLLRDYQRAQAARDKALLEMHPAAMERAGYWFRESVVPEPAPEPGPDHDRGPGPDYDPGPVAEPAPRPAALSAPAPGPDCDPGPGPNHDFDRDPGLDFDRGFEQLTEVEQYAVLYPRRAAQIRAARGLPANLDYGPPEPEIVAGLVHGTSPILLALDPPPLAVAAE
jgi:hypothetical protein